MDPDSSMSTPNVKPSGLEVDFDKNITKVYQAITSCNWDEAIRACELNPDEAKTWVVRHYDEEDSDGAEQEVMWRFLPIHSACARQPPIAVVTALLNAYPDGAKCVDDQGMYALHYACGNQASREVIRMLLMSFPDAAKIKDPRGMLPIHYLACWGPSSISVVDMVLVANRDVGNARDEDGNTPLDLAKEGEYPERDAVTAALKRWLDNTTTAPAQARSGSSRSPSNASVSRKENEEKKEAEPLSPINNNYSSRLNSSTPRNGANPPGNFTGQKMTQELAMLKRQTAEDQKEVARLHDRIRALELQVREGNNRVGDLQKQLEEKDRVVRDKDRTIDDKDREIADKEEDLLSANEKIKEKTMLLHTAYDERDGLRQTLADLTDQHDKFKKKSEILSDRIGSLNASLFGMLEQQNMVVDAMKAREEQWSALSDLRRAKMKELISLEEQESNEEVELKSCLMKQTTEMEALAAVIAAVRQNEPV